MLVFQFDMFQETYVGTKNIALIPCFHQCFEGFFCLFSFLPMLVPLSVVSGRRKSFGEQVSNSKTAGTSESFGAYSNTVVSINVPFCP